jgi:hypothetical protein
MMDVDVILDFKVGETNTSKVRKIAQPQFSKSRLSAADNVNRALRYLSALSYDKIKKAWQ